jgi:hypothetical protein
MTIHWTDKLVELNACEEAVEWARKYDTPEKAWTVCKRGDWMLWIAGRLASKSTKNSRARHIVVLAACACARLSLQYVPAGEERPLRAIETAERWARRESGVSLTDVRAATGAVAAAIVAIATHSAAAAATAAYTAACNAHDADADADIAAYASAAATSPYDTNASARKRMLKQCADVVRVHIPEPPRSAADKMMNRDAA